MKMVSGTRYRYNDLVGVREDGMYQWFRGDVRVGETRGLPEGVEGGGFRVSWGSWKGPWKEREFPTYLMVEDFLIRRLGLNERQLDTIDRDGSTEVKGVSIWVEEV